LARVGLLAVAVVAAALDFKKLLCWLFVIKGILLKDSDLLFTVNHITTTTNITAMT
jgi:hypothetical protein